MKTFFILILVTILCSCSSGGKKAIDKLYYRFPEPEISLMNNSNSFIVKRPNALGILGNRPMVAQNKEGGLIQMQHNFWLESPKILLQNYLSKIFVPVTNQATDSESIQVEILHLEKKQDAAILELKFIVRDSKGIITFNKTYQQQKKLTVNSIPQFVHSMADLLNLITQQFIGDLN